MTANAYSQGCWAAGIGLLILGSSCSLLFESQSTVANDAALSQSDARLPDGDAGIPRAMLSDDFESGSFADGWSGLDLENGDSCTITTDQAAGSSNSSLRCTTDGASGTRAAIYLDFAPTNTLHVEMDVMFETLPNSYLAFLQTSNVSDIANTRLISSDLYSSRKIDVWYFREMSFQYVNFVIETGTWYHINFTASIGDESGGASVSVDGVTSPRLSLPPTEAAINRLHLGITLVRDAIEAHTMYMDNIVISEG